MIHFGMGGLHKSGNVIGGVCESSSILIAIGSFVRIMYKKTTKVMVYRILKMKMEKKSFEFFFN